MSRRRDTEEMTAHLRSLKRYALVLTRNAPDADDLVQDTLLRALSAVDSFREGADMRVWLFRIMHNAHVSDGRRAQTRAAYLRAQGELEPPTAPAHQHDRLEVKAVLDALDTLPAPQREAVALMAMEDLRYVDAAKVLGIPLGTFMSRISRGREALRRLVEGTGRNHRRPEGVGA